MNNPLRLSVRVLPALLLLLPVDSGFAQEPQPSSPDEAAIANLQLGISYMRQGNLSLAREKIDKALRQAPKNADVHTAAAMLEERLGKSKEAEGHHRTAMRLAPMRPELNNNYAVYLCRVGKHAEGVRRFVEVANNKLYPTPQTAYTNAGVCARAGKQPDQAIGYFKRAMQIMPNHAEAVVQLADLELSRGRLTEARAEVDRFLTTFRAVPDVLLSCVQVARAQSDKLAEERCARRLRTDFPTSEAARRLPPTSASPR